MNSVSLLNESGGIGLSDVEIGCGKTQLSHTMSVVAQVPWNSPLDQHLSELKLHQLPPDMGGANGKVAYIGTACHISSPDGIQLMFAFYCRH